MKIPRASAPNQLFTAEEFGELAELGQPAELVRRIRFGSYGYPRHGQICATLALLLKCFAADDLGHVLTNDAGVITDRNPDTVRGADVSFYRYERLPRGPLPHGYLPVAPDVVFEVRSPSDRSSELLEKAADYLRAGVGAVCLLDPESETATVLTERGPARQLGRDERLELRPWLGDFAVEVRRFFE